MSTACEAPPPCPRCGSPTTQRAGRAGRFWGCNSWPQCAGSVDVGAPVGEHPVVRTRRLALRLLAKWGRRWTEDERHDAVGDALVSAMEAGWAARPEAWILVMRKALRALRGWQLGRDRHGRQQRYACRSGRCPVSIAGPAMALPTLERGDGALQRRDRSPSDWLEHTLVQRTAPEEALDAARWCELVASTARDIADEESQGRVALDVLRPWTSSALASELQVSIGTVCNWRSKEKGRHRNPSPEATKALIALALETT